MSIRLMKVMIVMGSIAATTSAARADQCQLVDTFVAGAAVKLIKSGYTVSQFCEACKDTKPSAPAKVGAIKITPDKTDKKLASVSVNGKEVDLAYTYVQTGKSTFTNVGLAVGCGARDVKPFITIGDRPAVVTDDIVKVADKLVAIFDKLATDLVAAGTDCKKAAAVVKAHTPAAKALQKEADAKGWDKLVDNDPAAREWFKANYEAKFTAWMTKAKPVGDACKKDPDFAAAMGEFGLGGAKKKPDTAPKTGP